MDQLITHNSGDSSVRPQALGRGWRMGSLIVGGAAIILAVATFASHRMELGSGLLLVAMATFCSVAFMQARFLYLARERHQQTSNILWTKECGFQAIFENALDTILILDDQGICCDANPAALRLLDTRREGLIGKSIAQFFADRHKFDCLWEREIAQGGNRGQFELARRDGPSAFVEFTATPNFLPNRHLMILRDVTQRRRAEEALANSLVLTKSAWQEAEALRKTTAALTQDLRMNYVLDTLLEMLHPLVPYESAQVLLLETESRLFLAREAFAPDNRGRLKESPKTLEVPEYPTLQRILGESRSGILIPDTLNEKEWRSLQEGDSVRSWIGVPLSSSNQVLGLLSLAHTKPHKFSAEHLRIAGSLAIPAAVAIQNARLYEQAEIYGVELERRISDLHHAEDALERSKENHTDSEERFRKLFRSTPIPYCVTSLAEGRFIDVNAAFEDRYGYPYSDLIGRTTAQLGFWEDPQERLQLVDELNRGVCIRRRVARFRLKSGELKASFYSAETIQLGGEMCLLVVSDDLPDFDSKHLH